VLPAQTLAALVFLPADPLPLPRSSSLPSVLLKYFSVTTENTATLAPVLRRQNSLLWTGALFLVLAILSNALFWVKVPGQHLLPWLNLILFTVPVPLFVLGLKRAIAAPDVYSSKGAGWFFVVASVLLFAFAVFALYISRGIPDASAAPHVGQKVPDFVLADMNRRNVSLQELLSMPLQTGTSPKAVLLVFYRGYW
jgi:hypothetical protein